MVSNASPTDTLSPTFAKIFEMTGNRTFTMIKPDAVRNGHIGAILDQICAAGFR